VEELELVWVCCGWCKPPTAHSLRFVAKLSLEHKFTSLALFFFLQNFLQTQCDYTFDTHDFVYRRWFSRNTNKKQLCNRMYYSKVYWMLNMFRAAHRLSSGALTVFAASGLYTHVVTGRCHSALATAGHHMGI
jgi:hypothetical protein